MQAVYEACEARSLEPKGPQHKFTCRCPAHEDRDPSLSVCEGADRRALVHCFAGCDPGDVVQALGLQWGDLFPDRHRNAGSRSYVPSPPVQNENPVEAILAALGVLGIAWHRTSDTRMYVADRCPGCDERRPGALWIFNNRIHVCGEYVDQARLTCFNGCTFEAITATLSHELTAYERAEAA
jgi:hypothetical protein